MPGVPSNTWRIRGEGMGDGGYTTMVMAMVAGEERREEERREEDKGEKTRENKLPTVTRKNV